MMGKNAISLRDALAALRPTQWTKNAVVLAAFVFAFWDKGQALGLRAILIALPAAALFCLTSSGLYVLNDIRDIEADRRHPQKRNRPVAAGRISIPAAATLSILLLAAGLGGSFALSAAFGGVVTAYVAIQLVYSFGLKRVALLDIMVIACGFVLRAIAGAVVLHVHISPWLLLCTFLLALFLVLCKRRHEKALTVEGIDGHRAALDTYDARLLDQLIAITSAATIVCYSIYTLSPETFSKFGTHKLGFTIPFVVFGIFRYLDLVYREQKGGRPEEILLTDAPTLVNLALYGASIVMVFVLHS